MSGGSLRLGEMNRSKSKFGVAGVHLGDAEAVADGRVGRRAAPLAEDFLVAGEVDDLVDGEEIRRVFAPGDNRQFIVELVA